MPKYDWLIERSRGIEDLTSIVQSFSLSWGRETFVSPYQGPVANITIRNNNEQADEFLINDKITIYQGPKIPFVPTPTIFNGIVINRDFIDGPGQGKGSTCVVTCVDGFQLLGTAIESVTLTNPNDTLNELGDALTNSNYGTGYIVFGETDAEFKTGLFSGNLQSQMQQTILADHGIFRFAAGVGSYEPPSNFGSLVSTTLTFGRTSNNTTMAYETLDRSEAASEATWFNNATVTGDLTSSTKSNGSFAEYGVKSFTTTSTQTNHVNSSAEWWANNFISPNRLSLNLSFVDVAQTQNALDLFVSEHLESGGRFTEVFYTPPGGTATSAYFWPERYTVNATPEQTQILVKMSNINTYQSFILNNTTFGVLDTSRLGVGEII